MDYGAMFDAVRAAALRLHANDEVTQAEVAQAEKVFNIYLRQDDGSIDFLVSVKIPVMHWLGRAFYRQARWRDAKSRLRDAFALSKAFPGTTPTYNAGEYEEIAAFVRDEIGPDLILD